MKWTQKLFLLVGALFGAVLLTSYTTPPSSSAETAKAEAQTAQAVTQDRITVLYDAFGKASSMKKDWGFSALVEVGGKRILFDTGNNSEIFAHNVKSKGVDLTKLDFVVMSHRHGDHIGGLNYLLSGNPNVAIYAPKENFGVGASTGATNPCVRRCATLTANPLRRCALAPHGRRANSPGLPRRPK